MGRILTNRQGHLACRALGRLGCVATVAWALSAQTPARADECGAVSCTDVTADYVVRVMENVLKDMRTDCRSVRTVRLLDKSVDNIMMIYEVRCDDGAGLQQYQLFYFVRDREITVDKFSGSFMKPITKKYPYKVGLEER
ncbi:hypothetical protein [Hansschlegelia zhihuaiae]|uniref:Uncharacterized protein n=1 Tax=Hansschlegelia zhihuaiae TaxID=405005 RepID=A0A4Q0M2X1_9HYPH|nr:hypothetical protein [Hansschlegelia zhihuaiae]RXF67204.1 hypothetical protein EK403_21600 [Hansschlegelia zhihuaiae]